MMVKAVKYSSLSIGAKKRIRAEYIDEQRGKCWHCQQPLNHPPTGPVALKPINTKLFPQNFFAWPVHLHHDHSTDMTIGVVHARCNAVLWQYHGQ